MSSSSLRPPPVPNPEPPKWKVTARFLMVVAAMLVALNVLGVLVYRRLHPAPPAPSAEELAAQSRAAQPEIVQPAMPSGPPAVAAVARAHRIAGLAALEEGDYTRAVSELAQAARMGGAGADVPELLRIAKELKDHQGKGTAAAAPTTSPSPASSAGTAVQSVPAPKPVRVVETPKSSSSKKQEQAHKAKVSKKSQSVSRAFDELEEAPAHGTLLVTSVPSGILVEVDGEKTDFTPARLDMETGLHEVAFVRGGVRLYERRITVNPNAVASLDADLSAQLEPQARAESTPSRERESSPAPAAATESRAAARTTPAPVPSAAPAPTPSAGPKGEIYVLSPEIYGDIFVNGTKYGPPPVLAKNIPAGKATVEVRINGVARRTLNVTVDPEHRQVARLR